ncbi:hypothetical protein [Fulvimonas yonginensis]|uniref:MmyB-like transcription regulator ligand binding domain-containing protein n=1 Tax=Fulvimonas yonginensis TaxID=1495200 RepID=A0ABU8JB70_9GAMM
MLRLSLHPAGPAPRIRNLGQWRAHLLHRLRQQIDASHDPALIALLRELQALPVAEGTPDAHAHRPLRCRCNWRSTARCLPF